MPYTQETIERARQRYQDGAPVADILAETGMSLHGLYYWLKGGPRSGPQHLPPVPLRLGRPRRRPLDREQVIARLWRTADSQVRDIEKRLGAGHEPSERERDARTLAVLVKTLRELVAFDDAAPKPATQEDDDPVPDDIDEFRNELARRIQALVDAQADAGVAGKPQSS